MFPSRCDLRKATFAFRLGAVSSREVGICGTIFLHALASIAILSSWKPPLESHHNLGKKSIKSTFYVGIGQADASLIRDSTSTLKNLPTESGHKKKGSGILEMPAPQNQSQRQTQSLGDEEFAAFLSPKELNMTAIPFSEPDYSLLDELPNTHLPIKLRLFIDEEGDLVGTRVLQADDRDDAAVSRIRVMFFIIKFLPARLNQKNMPSYLDIEFNIDDHMRVAPAHPSQYGH